MRLVFVIFVPINPLLFLSLSPKHTMNHSAAHEAAMADREFEVLNRIAVYRGAAKKIRPSENLNWMGRRDAIRKFTVMEVDRNLIHRW